MTSIREKITQKIRDELISGKFHAGKALRETELAKRFGVSRGPIRDAFLQLSQEGLLTYEVNKGVTVRPPLSKEDSAVVGSLRWQIEEHIISRGFDQIDDDGLASIAESLQDVQLACESGEVAGIFKAEMEFHEAILLACNGETHITVWRQLCRQALLSHSRYLDTREVLQKHLDIYKAIRAKQKDAALASIKLNAS